MNGCPKFQDFWEDQNGRASNVRDNPKSAQWDSNPGIEQANPLTFSSNPCLNIFSRISMTTVSSAFLPIVRKLQYQILIGIVTVSDNY